MTIAHEIVAVIRWEECQTHWRDVNAKPCRPMNAAA
jgi:hypothetical protein